MKRQLNYKLIGFVFGLLAVALVGAGKFTPLKADDTAGKLKIDYLDIGQGDSILLTTPHRKHILIDGGPDATVLTRLGEEMRFDEHTIDLMIASHNHSDHITGLDDVVQRYDVKKLWISGAIHTTNEYLKFLETIKDKHVPTEITWKGKAVNIDGVHIEVLFPLQDMEGTQPDDQHNATIVTLVQYGHERFLMTGDLDEDHEHAILESGANVQADILKVPHHGSATGLLSAFLDAVHPTYAVIQSGAGNKFGHPAPISLIKLHSRNIQIFRNDTEGTVEAITDGSTLTVKAHR